ncbi:MAG: PorP/SprF family type IX secretion system membrane protein [Bacteroidales bacterium]|jgi:type IX secretion system PorP/SprF family membrane protein|nr:PorP/SprF family type IX secretion system membrane protein [Bacteroidales bacterium]
MNWRFLCFVFLSCASVELYAQSVDFSQTPSNYIYTNPAFAGNNNCPTLYTSYRIKHFGEGNLFSTNFLSFDNYAASLNTDIGFTLVHDIQNSIFQTSGMSAIVAKDILIAKGVMLKYGLGLGYFFSNINKENLVFSDMINPFTPEIGTSGEDLSTQKQHLYDIEPCLLLYTYNIYVGVTAKHIQEYFRKQSYTNPLHATISIHAGGYFETSRGASLRYLFQWYPHLNICIAPSSSYTQLGMRVQKNVFEFGVAFRENFSFNAESFIFFVGLVQKKYKFAYNCDITLNARKQNYWNTHEISFSYTFDCKTQRKKLGAVQSPRG